MRPLSCMYLVIFYAFSKVSFCSLSEKCFRFPSFSISVITSQRFWQSLMLWLCFLWNFHQKLLYLVVRFDWSYFINLVPLVSRTVDTNRLGMTLKYYFKSMGESLVTYNMGFTASWDCNSFCEGSLSSVLNLKTHFSCYSWTFLPPIKRV